MQRVVCALVAIVVAFPSIVSAQPPGVPQPPGTPPRDTQAPQKTGTARLAGRVLSADTGRPLRRAMVRAMSPELREGRSVSTDAEGRWEIKDLPAGRYSIQISKGGYVSLSYGQRRPFEQGKPVELADAQNVERLDASLPKGSVITGRIVDEFGEALAGARVAALRYRYMQGTRRLMPAGGMGTFDTTDDIGQYRLHGLSPGEYYVSASLSTGFSIDLSADRTGYAETYYPGSASAAEAQRVSVGAGQETSEITFALTPARVAKISGTVTTSAGRPVANEMVMLSPADPGRFFGAIHGMGRTRPDGSFTISNVAAGEYRVDARAPAEGEGGNLPTAAAETASVPITVTGQDVSGLAIVTAPTATATGRIVFEGGTPPGVLPGSVTIFAAPENPMTISMGTAPARVRDDWTFEMKGLSGRRFIRVPPPPTGWAMKSIMLNDRDVTDSVIEFKPGESLTGLEITLTQRMPSISGIVQGDRDAPADDYVVVAFSSENHKWGFQTRYIRTARPDQSGKFVIRALPPDEYMLVALDYLEPGEEADPELLESLRRFGTRVTLAEGESKTLSLKLARPR